MVEPVVLAALAIDAGIGWPAPLYAWIGHPVGLFARGLNLAERRFNRPTSTATARRFAGVLTIALLLIATILGTLGIEHLLATWLGKWRWLVLALLAWPGLAQRSLYDHVAPVGSALAAGDLSEAQRLVARIVGRDVDALDEAGISRAAIESLAESFCDGVVAPALWLIVAGLPGLWGYKALNTADSLIGHKEPRWRAFGWASARGDDAANWVPARLAGGLICLVGGRGWFTMMRDARHHASPNAGWPEAAMAGALGLSLAGPIAYDGTMHEKAWIGNGRRNAGAADIADALRLYRRACLALWLIAGGVAWLR